MMHLAYSPLRDPRRIEFENIKIGQKFYRSSERVFMKIKNFEKDKHLVHNIVNLETGETAVSFNDERILPITVDIIVKNCEKVNNI